MRNIIKGFALTMLVTLMLTGCETDNKTLLTDGVWNFSNLTTNSEDELITSLIALGKAVLTDATMEFQEGGTYILTSPLIEEPTTGEWSLIGEDQLILDADDEVPSPANIETLTKDRLSYMETYVDAEMNPYTITTTWVR
jgi:hypothetical protein